MKFSRRKLIKATAAAPLVLTVPKAGAWAITSATACLRTDADKPDPYDILRSTSAEPDGWMRSTEKIYRLKEYSAGQWRDRGLHILGTDNRTYWKLDPSNPYSSPASPTAYYSGQSGLQATVEDQKNVMLYMDDNCNVVGKHWDKNYGKHVTKSCWASVKAAG
ncbi:MAG: hypothetical protein N2544_16150 [Burkholderiales bacterium]|nr:hypothetical protein [Burkholderiales bacterium]